jgi:hypothetical protein
MSKARPVHPALIVSKMITSVPFSNFRVGKRATAAAITPHSNKGRSDAEERGYNRLIHLRMEAEGCSQDSEPLLPSEKELQPCCLSADGRDKLTAKTTSLSSVCMRT